MREKISNKMVQDMLEVPVMEEKIRKMQLKWAAKLARMSDTIIPRKFMMA